jgi:DNA mismatch repair ATPase MutS
VDATSTDQVDPGRFYAARRADAQAIIERLARTDGRIGGSRLLVATALVIALWQGHRALAAALAVAFVGLVVAHARTRRALRRASAEVDACDAGTARMARAWERVPPFRDSGAAIAADSPTARDLDVSGDRSVLHLLGATSPFGTARLEEWLLGDPAPLASIAARQASVHALRTRPDMLLDAAIAGRRAPSLPRRHLEHLHRWGTESHRLRSVARRIVAGATIVTLVAAVAATASGFANAASLVVLLLVVNLTLTALARRQLARSFHGLNDAVRQLEGAVDAMRRLSLATDVDGALGELQRRLRSDHAVGAVASLQRLLTWNEVQYSPMGHWALNAVAGFDALLIEALGSWGARHGSRVHEWFHVVGDAEALLALGTLAFENPGWTLPEVHDDGDAAHLVATRLRHPLLAPDVAVGNDVELRSAGDVLIVSGSNMSGKTTYLRAVGVNVLLAGLGGPVAADAMSLRRVRVRTSVRVSDDLSGGVSLFLAEVRRLRDIVSDAELPGLPPVLFLFDEILHGTNTVDRRLTTRDVLARLSAARAVGIVTTHDPEIAHGWDESHGADADGAHVRQIHFRDTLVHGDGEPTMTFDYRAWPGPATTSNARRIWAALMERPRSG